MSEAIDPEDIRRVLQNKGFTLVVNRAKAALVRKVMSKRTSQEDRDAALADHHAIDRILTELEKASGPKQSPQ